MGPERQICYVAWGSEHVQLAARSARSARQHTPDVRIVAHLDAAPSAEDRCAFDEVIIDVPSTDIIEYKQLKARALMSSRADLTIFLDADTVVAADLREIFDLLRFNDLAAAIDPTRTIGTYRKLSTKGALSEVPASAPFLNSGLIGVRRSEKTLQFLQAWHDAIEAEGVPRDQWTFRRLVYEHDLKLRILPPEFNVRTLGPVTLSGPVRILHMYDMPQHTAPEVLAFLNSWTGNRVFTPHDGRMLEQLQPGSVRYQYLSEFSEKTVHHQHPKLAFRQHLRDIVPSLVRSIRYRLFRRGALAKLPRRSRRPG